MATKKTKKFNVVEWTPKNGKLKVISWTTKESVIAYLKDLLRHMEEEKTTKFEVFYSDKTE